LTNFQVDLSTWSSRKFGNTAKKLKQKTKQLEALQRDEGLENWENIKLLHSEIDFILEQEDFKWKQRAKQNWYQYGDHNTPFFHAWANHRRKTNHIRQVVDEAGACGKHQRRLCNCNTPKFIP
jgi:hypothetical protein